MQISSSHAVTRLEQRLRAQFCCRKLCTMKGGSGDHHHCIPVTSSWMHLTRAPPGSYFTTDHENSQVLSHRTAAAVKLSTVCTLFMQSATRIEALSKAPRLSLWHFIYLKVFCETTIRVSLLGVARNAPSLPMHSLSAPRFPGEDFHLSGAQNASLKELKKTG
ncbi:uncharacterized protein CIMG_05760 [Coccidioides immitis RS]|uniref:Uncharacterized protein n=1 Tax=Coccidioides immitis (strain RS) TaxID=246410 RepID=J3K6Q6_COCIM|nr:uncharacterized protein CIMG_05760 [Coccidioides immitis RS]EAS30281.3 hypothetical protein CIMG_05760 [Coccidioides immitis RS]